MPLPKGYLPRKGDKMLTISIVTYDCEVGDADVHVAMVGTEHRKYIIPLAEIHSLHIRKWSAGDRVSSKEFDGPGTVLAVSDDWVWVLCETGDDAGGKYTLPANDLEPYVEPEHPDIVAIGETADAIAARDEAANR